MPRARRTSNPVSGRREGWRVFAYAPPRRVTGFSLVEMLVALTVLAIVVSALTSVLIHAMFARLSSTNRFESLQTARAALDMISRDLRSAGYGVDAGSGSGAQPAIAYVDSMQILMCENQQPYPDASGTGLPQAYDPAGSPRPRPLVGSAWTPPVKYGTGAEIIRYTLDLNDDGFVDAGDIASAEGADARRTRQPDDYTLVRQVYGDRSGGVAGNNGGAPERIALVLKPGGTVAPLFNVYLGSSATPWNWSSGPVPAAQLAQITRVEVNVTASSPNADSRGIYSLTPLVNQALLQRNAPNFGAATYTVDGWVYQDDNGNRARDYGEAGLAGASVRLGNGRVVYTNASGYYAFRVPTGNYLLKHSPPTGFGSYSNPDSFNLSVAGAMTRSFADTMRTGGWVTVSVFDDADGNGAWGAGESGLGAVNLSLVPAGMGASTNASGIGSLFATTGSWNVSATPPANYSLTTTNPVPITMTSGGAATASFGMRQATSGTVAGRVYWDRNTDGTYNGTDTGIASVTVSVKDAAGVVTIATGTSDANGSYSIAAPATSGGATYTVTCPAVAGYFATTAMAYTGVTVSSGQAVSGKDFGFQHWALSSLTTGAVTCMALADVWENDGSGAVPNTRRDVDLLLGYNDGSGGHAGLWANGYPNAAPFAGAAGEDLLWWDSTAPTAILADSATNLGSPSAPYPLMGFPTSAASGENDYNWAYDKRPASATWPSLYTSKSTRKTADGGTVSALLVYDMTGSTANDVLVGTRYTTANRGGFEVWRGSASNGVLSWSQFERYPNAGSVPGQTMGEVNAMALGDIDRDGRRDLVVATQLSATSGAVMIFKYNGSAGGDLFTLKQTISFASEAPKTIAVGDIDGDGRNDIVVGTQTSSTTGNVYFERNTYGTTAWSFSLFQTFAAPGAVTAMAIGDVGGSSAPDIVVGYGSSTVSTLGGARVYNNVAGALDPNGIDPTNGALTRWVTALCLGNLNYGTSPSTPPAPYLTDIAIGWKQSTTAGGVTVLVR